MVGETMNEGTETRLKQVRLSMREEIKVKHCSFCDKTQRCEPIPLEITVSGRLEREFKKDGVWGEASGTGRAASALCGSPPLNWWTFVRLDEDARWDFKD